LILYKNIESHIQSGLDEGRRTDDGLIRPPSTVFRREKKRIGFLILCCNKEILHMHHVIIIGGGIGGLTAAIALQRRGIAAHVYEAAPELRTVGAGISLQANAVQVLDRLGLAETVRRAGAAPARAELLDERGTILQTIDLRAIEQRYGFPTIAIHRARLHDALLAQLAKGTLHLGKAARQIEQDGQSVHVQFADGSTAQGSVALAADGVRSGVRRQLFPEAQPRYSGQSSYRAVMRTALPIELEQVGQEIWGRGRRFGFSPIGGGEVYCFATLDAPPGVTESVAQAKAQLQELFASFPAPVSNLIAAAEAEQLIRTDMDDLRPLPRWYHGRVALLGDAAHATTPNLGQGGAQAIEDAWVLAESLARYAAPEQAFAAYQRTRQAKATMVVNRSWQMGKLAHLKNPLGRALRNALMRGAPPSLSQKQFDALYSLNY
jgi:2-polyprenyl-6-methoxyphenol hydroxylase-like FAD-dependent oxidoreductase